MEAILHYVGAVAVLLQVGVVIGALVAAVYGWITSRTPKYMPKYWMHNGHIHFKPEQR